MPVSPEKHPDAAQEKLSNLVEWLAKPTTYPDAPQSVEHLETHISHIFLTGDYVYKLKKPVRFDFLDYLSLAAREQACRDEVRLNRRLAPHAYLNVIPITANRNGEWQLSGEGEVIDWLVHMRRLPTEQSLDALHAQGKLTPEHIDRLGKLLADFYRSQPALPISGAAYRTRLISHVEANRRELLASQQVLPRSKVARVHAFQLQLLALQPELFDERVAQGRVVDGHGDLRPEHICLTDPPTIFDCIEFRDEFRHNDVADELAFLVTECELLGADWVGPRLLEIYEHWASDRISPILWTFYRCYRSCVRVKVAILRAAQEPSNARDAALEDARKHLDQADKIAAAWIRPLAIAVGGVSGSGKSTLARALAEVLGTELLRTDVIRNELFEVCRSPAASTGERYSLESRGLVYGELFKRAAALGRERVSVVLDGTFSNYGMIEQAFHAIGDVAFLAIECHCSPEVARDRIAHRLKAGTDASEAQPETHDTQRQAWVAWPTCIPQIRVNSEAPLETQVEVVLNELRKTVPAIVSPLA